MYHKTALSKLNQRYNILFLILEVFAIIIAIYFNNGINPSSYILIAAIFLLFVGLIKSQQSLLLRFFRGTKKRQWLRRINSLIEGSEHSQNIYFLGDWFQIVAIGLVWNSLFSLLISCVAYPTVAYIISSIETRSFNANITDETPYKKNEVWMSFVGKTIRGIVIALLPLIPWAITIRDLRLFFGTLQDAVNLITTLSQVEATVFALVVTFLFVLVEFTNSAYSPRLVKSFTSRLSFKSLISFVFASIVIKFLLLANVSLYIDLAGTPDNSVLMDWTILLTILSVFGYYIFIRDIINLMQPDAIAKQILTKFDQSWIEVVRRNWMKQNRVERLILSGEDPMILFERYLATTIERGDIYSTKVALILMRDKISSITHKDDGVIIDEYLFNRIGNIIDVLANKHSDLGLEIFCDIVHEITTPSVDVLKNSKSGMLDVPPGAHLLRYVVEKAVDYQLLDSGRRAIHYLDKRCEAAIKALPAYSDLWLINPVNLENQQIDKDKFWRNDRQLESVLYGYFRFFEEIAIKAVKERSRELAYSLSHVMSSQILHVVNAITEEPYQRYLVLNCLWHLEEIVKTSCEEKFAGAITFGILSFGVEKIENESTAMIMSTAFAKFIQLMTKAEILDSNHVRDIAVMAVYLARKYPHATIPILDSLGIAGESFKKAKSDTRQENLNYVLNEILGRIDQVEKAGLFQAQSGIKTKIAIAAKKARNKINQNAANKYRKTAKN